MPSPFPGMNPWLEQPGVCHDFHQSFIPLARAALRPQVRGRYIVSVETQLFIHEPSADDRRHFGTSDVGLSRRATPAPGAGGAAAAVQELPVEIWLPPVLTERHSYLEIRDLDAREVVCVLELLSPTNKYAGGDRELYLGKRQQLLASTASLVEIDLLRGGPRLPMPGLPACDYCIFISRGWERPKAGAILLRLAEPLPTIPIPLREGEPEAGLDLQTLLHTIYDTAGYEEHIYEHEPRPRLTPDQETWARQFLPSAA